MKAHPDEELACRAHNLPPVHPAAPRGVISYYATAALPTATTLADWLHRFNTLVRQDVDAGQLPAFYQPDVHLLGDGSQPAPGTAGQP